MLAAPAVDIDLPGLPSFKRNVHPRGDIFSKVRGPYSGAPSRAGGTSTRPGSTTSRPGSTSPINRPG
eukprot:8122103-Pyramimonas_sp.AAC.1